MHGKGVCPPRVDEGAAMTRDRVFGIGLLAAAAAAVWTTQMVSLRFGRLGRAALTGGVTTLALRDAGMVRAGVPGRLRPMPRALLYLELGAATSASLLGATALRSAARPALRGGRQRLAPRPRLVKAADRFCELTFFLHTLRQAIYLMPSSGRLKPLEETLAASGKGRL